MKKLFFLYMIGMLLIGMWSCEEDYVPESTNAVDFAGDWFYEVQSPDGDVYLSYDYESDFLMTYNSSENRENEVWIDDQEVFLYFKSKFTLEGEPSEFSSSDLAINEYEFHEPDEDPTSAGESAEVEIDYGVVGISNGKILEDAATVWQDKEQATADSIYFETEFYTATFNFNSVESDTEGEFVWELDDPAFSIDEATEEIYVVSGHRKTGWEVHIE
ncbi:MAG: lipid-binding protein [Bacteroidota bacterium]